jgi:hypothetical protein
MPRQIDEEFQYGLKAVFYRPPATTFEGMKAHFPSITRIFGWNLKNILSNQNRY